MKHRIFLGALVLGLCVSAPALAQVKPAESTSKVKRVMRFTKIAGYVHDLGQRDLLATLNTLATQKGFTLTNQANDALLTPAYLSQFQVIIWDNNVDGGGSVPSVAAREAVINYVNNGGGWILVHGAADHKNTWPALQTALQTTFSRHGSIGAADVVMDAQGLAHKELKWMMNGWPATVRFPTDEWYSFQNTVRGRPGITVIATAKNGASGVIVAPADGSNDLTYVYAKEMGKGRMLYTAMGHGGNSFYTQADGFATKAIWENIRYAAGDFQNGCTNRNSAQFDSTARVDDGTCPATGISNASGVTHAGISVVGNGYQTRLNFPHEGKFSVELRDARGALVWSRTLENTSEVRLDGSVRPGMYHLVAKAGKNVVRHRLTLL